MDNNKILEEARETIRSNLNAGYAVPHLIRIIEKKDAEIEQLEKIVDEVGDVLPSCIDCEGKTVWGERTDKCVYETDTDRRRYCTKRGVENSLRLMSENRQLKEEVERLKPFEKKVLEPVLRNLKEIELVKSEAYKEFAERLKARYCTYESLDTICADEIRENIEKLVKELTEVSK